MEYSVPDRLMDQFAWALRIAQYDALMRAGTPATAAAPLLWRNHNASGLKHASAQGFERLASADV